MQPVVVGGELTKTSQRWSRRPGNFDLLNLKMVFAGTPPWGVPAVAPDDFEPTELIAYNFTRDLHRSRRDGAAVHFFLDDYRFEACWTNPDRALARVQLLGQALGPDFSVLTWMPLAMMAWQVYRARWVSAYWQHHGIRVIPTATWAGPDSYALCWAGLPHGGALAVSAVGIGNAEPERSLFRKGLHRLSRTLSPSRLIVYGGLGDLADGLELPPVREYPTLQEIRGWRHRARTIAHDGAGAQGGV